MSFFAELRQRNVLKVATAYAVVSWLILQVMDTVAPALHLPPWTLTLIIVLLVIGLPIALLFAWAFELTPDGIKPEREVKRAESITHKTGRKLDFIIIGVLVLALGYFVSEKYLAPQDGISTEVASPVPTAGQSIAVLPFENRSDVASDEFFTDGIHDDLLTQISRIPDIKTISRTSVLAYRDTTKNMRQIGEELGVATLLEGGVQRAGDQVRINVQLIDVASDAHVWAETYTRNMTAENIFAIQTEITLAIADALRAVLSPDEKRRLEEDLPTDNLAALEAYFRGKMYENTATSAGYDRAIAEYEQAVAEDDEFAVAHAALAKSHLQQVYFSGRAVERQVALARPHVERAMAIDADLPEAWNALASLNRNEGKQEDAIQAYQRTLELDPNNAAGYQDYASFQRWGALDLDEAERLFARAYELDPKNPGVAKEYAEAMLTVNKVEGAVALLEGLIRDHPEYPGSYQVMGEYERAHLHQYARAIQWFRRASELDPQNPDIAFQLAAAYRSLGDADSSAFWAEKAADIAPNGVNAEFYRGIAAIVQNDRPGARSHFSNVTSSSYQYIGSLVELHFMDMESGQPEVSVNRWLTYWPALGGDEYDDVMAWYSVCYIDAVAAAGEDVEARRLAAMALPRIEKLPRVGKASIGLSDALVQHAIHEQDAALRSIREYVNAGGADARIFGEPFFKDLRDDPEFMRLVDIMKRRLDDQRASLASMEASDELAPVKPLTVPHPDTGISSG